MVRLEPPQGGFQRSPDFFGPGIIDKSAAGLECDPEFGGDLYLVPIGLQRGPHQVLIVFVRTVIADVDFRCVKKCVAMFYCRLDDPGHFLLVRRRAEGVGHAHAAQAHRRYLQAVS